LTALLSAIIGKSPSVVKRDFEERIPPCERRDFFLQNSTAYAKISKGKRAQSTPFQDERGDGREYVRNPNAAYGSNCGYPVRHEPKEITASDHWRKTAISSSFKLGMGLTVNRPELG
jgi:hypothetical protein